MNLAALHLDSDQNHTKLYQVTQLGSSTLLDMPPDLADWIPLGSNDQLDIGTEV